MRIVAVVVVNNEVDRFKTTQVIIESLRTCNVVEMNECIEWSAIGNVIIFFRDGLVYSPNVITEGVLS